MRNEVRVIWLEDSIRGANKRPHESRVKAVEEYIESKGYQPNIKVVTNISEAKRLLTIRGGEERYDFFISDFDLLQQMISIRLNMLNRNLKSL